MIQHDNKISLSLIHSISNLSDENKELIKIIREKNPKNIIIIYDESSVENDRDLRLLNPKTMSRTKVQSYLQEAYMNYTTVLNTHSTEDRE